MPTYFLVFCLVFGKLLDSVVYCLLISCYYFKYAFYSFSSFFWYSHYVVPFVTVPQFLKFLLFLFAFLVGKLLLTYLLTYLQAHRFIPHPMIYWWAIEDILHSYYSFWFLALLSDLFCFPLCLPYSVVHLSITVMK